VSRPAAAPARPRPRRALAAALPVAGAAAAAAWPLGPQTAAAVRWLLRWPTPTHVAELVLVAVVVALGARLAPAGAVASRPAAALRAAADRAGRALAGVPPLVVLTALVGGVAAVRIALGAAETLPVFLGDELLYVDQAKSLALFGQPLLRGDVHIGTSLLYPLFLSPAYRLSADGVRAYEAARAMNAVAAALAAVPAYYLARRLLTRGWSLAVAALTAVVPWTGYAALALTESLFYLAFTTFALVLARTLEQPLLRRQLTLLVALGVLVGVRPQALAVAAAVVLAILALGALERSLWKTVRTYAPTLVLLALAAVGALAAAAAGLPVPTGGYKALFGARLGPLGVAKWTVWNLEVYGVATGVAALLAFPFALGRMARDRARPAARAVAVTSAALFAGIVASVAALSASPYGYGILHERGLFYVTPLVLTALAYRATLPRRSLPWGAGLATALVVGAASLPGHVLRLTNDVDGPTAVAVVRFTSLAARPPPQTWVAVAAALGGAVFLLARRPLLPFAALLLGYALVWPATDYRGPLAPGEVGWLAWVDRALPRGATATLLQVDLPRPALPCAEAAEYEQQGLHVWTEFFNVSVTRLFRVYGTSSRDNLPAPLLTLRDGGLLLDGGRPLAPRYVVVDSRQPIAGRRIARFDLASIGSPLQEGASLTLWRAAPPLRLRPLPAALPPRADGRGC